RGFAGARPPPCGRSLTSGIKGSTSSHNSSGTNRHDNASTTMDDHPGRRVKIQTRHALRDDLRRRAETERTGVAHTAGEGGQYAGAAHHLERPQYQYHRGDGDRPARSTFTAEQDDADPDRADSADHGGPVEIEVPRPLASCLKHPFPPDDYPQWKDAHCRGQEAQLDVSVRASFDVPARCPVSDPAKNSGRIGPPSHALSNVAGSDGCAQRSVPPCEQNPNGRKTGVSRTQAATVAG